MKKIILFTALLALFALFFYFDGGKYLTLASIKQYQDSLREIVDQNLVLSWSAYFLIYVIATAISIPGAVFLTLVAAAIFGFWSGLLLVSFASSLGATLAFLISRYLFRSMIENKFSDKLASINKHLAEEGAMYLFTLRLIPIFPFFLINALFGLTKIKASVFYGVSQIGMLAGTIVYVNAGTQLGKIETTADIVSPELLFSFALLGLFPLITKKIVNKYQQAKIYRPYPKPKTFDYNLIVIGAGSGGLVASYIAAAVKSKVCLIEQGQMGGDCLNTGCVPSKALISTSKLAHQINNANIYAIFVNKPIIAWSEVISRVKKIIAQIAPHDSIERYQKLGVNVIQGKASIIDPYTVQVNGELLSTKNIVIATGAKPYVPNIAGLEQISYLTSDNLWQLKSLPKKLLIIGGGAIGCELAQAFNRLGSEVTQVIKHSLILPKEDEDVARFVQERFLSEGIKIITNAETKSIKLEADIKYFQVLQNQNLINIEFDQVLFAIGRKANIKGFGLNKLGIKTNATIIANEFMATNFPNIYTVGDVTGPLQFTHVASHQAWYASVNALFGKVKKFKVDYRVIPKVIFTDPEIAQVGLNETLAKEQNIDFEVTKYEISDLDRAITESSNVGWVKVLTVPKKDKILGVSIVSSHAGELIAEFVLAMKYNLGLNKILATIHAYPTWCEANKYVAGVWKRSHTSPRILTLLKKYHRWQRGKK